MDADDRLDEVNRARLRNLLTNLPTELLGFVMKCLCLSENAADSATAVDHVRLFPNHPDLRWKFRIHEQILLELRRLGGTVRWSDVVIHHIGYQDAHVRQLKLKRDQRLLLLEDQENPDNPFTLFNLGSAFLEQRSCSGQGGTGVLQRSLQLSHPSDSIVRKLYSLLAHATGSLGKLAESQPRLP